MTDDLISRQAAIEALLKGKVNEDESLVECPSECNSMIDCAIEDINALPSVPTADVVERKVGKWVEPTREGCITYDKHAYAECSACGEKAYLGWWMRYCPNCGARMFDKDNNVPNKGESDG